MRPDKPRPAAQDIGWGLLAVVLAAVSLALWIAADIRVRNILNLP